MTFLLLLFTVGIYGYWWLYQQTKAINSYFPERPVISRVFVGVALYALVPEIGLYIASGLRPEDQTLAMVSNVLSLAGNLLFIVWAFKVRDGIQSLIRIKEVGPYRLDALATFLLSVLYLQYKINRMPDLDAPRSSVP